MKKKSLAREITIQLLFQLESQGLINPSSDSLTDNFLSIDTDSIVRDFLASFYRKNQNNLEENLISSWLLGIINNLAKIDNYIDKASFKWRLNRLNAIDRAILRLAVFELFNESKLSSKIIINEAIELAKKYGGDNSGSFINGVLDSINKNLASQQLKPCKT